MGAGAPLEQLQGAAAPVAAACADLPLLQHGLTDVGPEVASAAQPGGAVGRAQAAVAHLTWRHGGNLSVSVRSTDQSSIKWRAAPLPAGALTSILLLFPPSRGLVPPSRSGLMADSGLQTSEGQSGC